MPDETPGSVELRDFLNQYSEVGMLSTGATVVNFAGDLYNVTGSTEDPKGVPDYRGWSWKKLLIDRADLAEANCYVTNERPPSVSSHAKFSVGGHMTTAASGIVSIGEDSYLMPLCSWHNSTARDGRAFAHAETRMLKLSGYMQGELAVTFAMRSAGGAPFGLTYYDTSDRTWRFQQLDKKQALAIDVEAPNNASTLQCQVLFERQPENGGTYFVKAYSQDL